MSESSADDRAASGSGVRTAGSLASSREGGQAPTADGVAAAAGSTPEARAERVKTLAREVGFDFVGIAPPETGPAWDRYERAMAAGYGADMEWLGERPELRRDVRNVHPPARSVVVVGASYASDVPGVLEDPPGPDRGWIARYAQGTDYHVVLRKMLVRLARRFEKDPLLGHPSVDHRVFVDTGPVLEKALAQLAGVGWIGKNSLLLHRELGSWCHLGVVLTPLELAFDRPETDHCGSCRRCLDVCPTGAFPEPYVLDARRCIATWTIESRDPARDVDPETVGPHVFGCDLCQEVCPWNRKAPPTRHAALRPRPENVRPLLRDLAALDGEAAFRLRFPNSAVRRTDAARFGAVVRRVGSRRRTDGGGSKG